jgi:1,2-diacylglycerol 3-alpha-glucosyltransferase
MHIAHFSNTYYPVISGVVRSVSSFRKALSELGHNVFVFAQHSNDYQDKEPFIFRYPAINIPMTGDAPAAIPISPCIDQLIPALKLDVIHSHHPILVGQVAANKAEELDLPLVFTFHSQYSVYTQYIPINQESVQDFLKDTVEYFIRDYIKKCQHVIVPSESMRNILIESFGLEDHVSVIPTGLDMKLYRNADGELIRQKYGWKNDKVLISAGRLAPEKNWETLIKAVARVAPNHPDLRLVLIGDGQQREALEKLAEDLEIGDRVEFIGKIPFAEIPHYFKAADFFGFASVTETQGLVTMEAMACGLPVAAVDATGTSDVVTHEVDGLLTKNSTDALAAAIERLLTEDGLLTRFREATLEKSTSFDILVHARKLVEVYQQAIQDKRDHQYVKVSNRPKPLQEQDSPKLKPN